jgi:glucuronosyltransferase
MVLRMFFIFCLINKFISGANILAITTLLSPSHHLFNDVYLFELAKRGHNVTLLGHDEDKHSHPNYTHIIMEGKTTSLSPFLWWTSYGYVGLGFSHGL